MSATERDSLFSLPEREYELIRRYSFNETDLSVIRQRRGDPNRLGFAVQLCLLRYSGYALSTDRLNAEPLIRWVTRQVGVETAAGHTYAEREETWREHIQALRTYLGLTPFGAPDFRRLVHDWTDLALRSDKGRVFVARAFEFLRGRRVVLPGLPVIERASAQAVTRADGRLHRFLIEPLTDDHRQRLDALLQIKPDSTMTWLVGLRQSPLQPNSRYMLEHISRLRAFQALGLPSEIGRNIHQNRLLKMAREGG